MSEFLDLATNGAVARLTIDRIDRRNAFTQKMWEKLPVLVEEAMATPSVRVLLIQSAASGIFSAGADIAEFSAGARDPDWRQKNQAAIGRAQRVLARAPKPTIAVIEGACVGGGCGLALACDLRVAAPAARFGITPARLGLVYSLHDTKLLVDLVGPAQAKRILFTGDLIDSAEALRIGLVDLMDADAATLADSLARQIAAMSPHSVKMAKAMIRRILDGQIDDDDETRSAFSAAFEGPDHQEGVAAFLEKRAPDFRK